MEQSELGKTEEEIVDTSSAELPESQAETSDNGQDENTDAQNVTEVDGQDASADDTATDTTADADGNDADDDDDDGASASDASDASDEEDEEEGEIAEDDPARKYKRGQLVEGKIHATSPTAVEIRLDDEVVGQLPQRELETMTRKTIEGLVEGEPILIYVVNPRNHRGETLVSINLALEEQDWRDAEGYAESKEVFDGKIGGYNKGGLIVRFGRLRGFVPQSQIADTRLRLMSGETPEERYSGLVNTDISVKVMEVDRQRNRLILSERAAMREVRQRRKESLITELQVGEEREGVVVSLENFGAFVDIGGAEGLVHLTEISWKHVTHPRQALSIGDEVNVKVISVDADQNRIGLSIRSLQADPWDEIAVKYGAGSLVRGTVTKLTKFGAFARLHGEETVEGLVHISELSDERVEHPREVVKKGDELTLRVVKVDVKNRRLGLSLKRVNSAEFLDQDMKRAYDDLQEHQASGGAEAQAPVDETPADEAPADEVPANEAPTDEAPVDEAPADNAGDDSEA
jgi:small subunit ribosomal protein S1